MDRDREGGIKTENLKKINKKIVLDNQIKSEKNNRERERNIGSVKEIQGPKRK